jgi:hypothetical protein
LLHKLDAAAKSRYIDNERAVAEWVDVYA